MWVIRRLEACYNVILLQVKEKQKGILDGSYPVVMVEVKPVFLTQLTSPCISLIKTLRSIQLFLIFKWLGNHRWQNTACLDCVSKTKEGEEVGN